MSGSLHIKAFSLGPWMTNCYVVYTDSGACWIVDAGYDPEPMIAFIEEHGLKPQQVVLTHAHLDHIGGLAHIIRHFGPMPILIHEAEKDFPGDASLNLSLHIGMPLVAPEPTQLLKHGDTLELDGHRFEVRHTPGHSPGGICLYNAEHKLALVGDTLFDGSIGRHDFPTSDFDALQRSIREQLYTLPDDTRVLPGHMGETTIGKEKRTNPYVRG